MRLHTAVAPARGICGPDLHDSGAPQPNQQRGGGSWVLYRWAYLHLGSCAHRVHRGQTPCPQQSWSDDHHGMVGLIMIDVVLQLTPAVLNLGRDVVTWRARRRGDLDLARYAPGTEPIEPIPAEWARWFGARPEPRG